MLFSEARGKLILEKILKQKISWHCPFKYGRDTVLYPNPEPEMKPEPGLFQSRNRNRNKSEQLPNIAFRYLALLCEGETPPDLNPASAAR